MMVLCEPKNFGEAFIILTILTILEFYKFVCISWTIKCLILLMYGATMKSTEDLAGVSFYMLSVKCI